MFSSFPGSGLQQKSGGFCLLCRDVSADLMFAFEIFLLNVRSSRRTDLFPVFLGKDVCDPVIKESREHSGLVWETSTQHKTENTVAQENPKDGPCRSYRN